MPPPAAFLPLVFAHGFRPEGLYATPGGPGTRSTIEALGRLAAFHNRVVNMLVLPARTKADDFLFTATRPLLGRGATGLTALNGFTCATHKYLMWSRLSCLRGHCRPGLFGKARAYARQFLNKGALGSSGTRPLMLLLSLLASPEGNKTWILEMQTPVARPRGFTSASGFGHGPTTRANTRVLALRDKRLHCFCHN